MLARSLLGVGLAMVLALAGCDRNIEPYDPSEPVRTPDLSKIFPEGAERAAQGQSGLAELGAEAVAAPGSGPRGAPPPARGGEPLSGRILLAPELAERVPAGAVLFLIARAAEAGPPTAVQRIPDPRFPLAFSIGPGDRMIEAMPFAGPFTLTARVDRDGNAMTRNPGDLQGRAAASHAPGDSGIEIVIDEML